jgi:hypothetical protein
MKTSSRTWGILLLDSVGESGKATPSLGIISAKVVELDGNNLLRIRKDPALGA